MPRRKEVRERTYREEKSRLLYSRPKLRFKKRDIDEAMVDF